MFAIESPDFSALGEMPAALTCDGADLSPALHWRGAPDGTQSYVLIVDDPDAPDPAAPKMTYVHWVVYNIPASVTELTQGVAIQPPAQEGMNDWGRVRYGGPCPPIGRHRYFHKIYALNKRLDIKDTPDKARLLEAMQGHVLAEAQIVGTYIKAR